MCVLLVVLVYGCVWVLLTLFILVGVFALWVGSGFLGLYVIAAVFVYGYVRVWLVLYAVPVVSVSGCVMVFLVLQLRYGPVLGFWVLYLCVVRVVICVFCFLCFICVIGCVCGLGLVFWVF